MDEPRAILKGVAVSRSQVTRAMDEFDLEAHEQDWLENKAQLYVVMRDDRAYPPKRILSIATGLPVRSFHGGAEANGALAALGFTVLPKEALNAAARDLEAAKRALT